LLKKLQSQRGLGAFCAKSAERPRTENGGDRLTAEQRRVPLGTVWSHQSRRRFSPGRARAAQSVLQEPGWR
jgi:hypothetical protein